MKRELIDDKCSHHPKLKIKVVNEENYFFRLSKYKNELFEKISSDEYKVIPKKRKNEILSFLKDAKDISFSRPKKSLPWGISVPGDDEQVMYVWCDALSNYITGIGYGRDKKKFDKLWPADVHIIGKDILRFHAAFWPAMLLSANISLPKKLLVHGFILSSGAKMSKSSGNVIEPFSQIEKYGSEIFKFYLIETMPLESDGEYSEELLVERVNTELVGNLANFIYRTLSFLNKNFDGSMIIAKDDEFTDLIESKFKEAKSFYENYDLRNALNTILRISAIGNKYFQDNEPWALIKKDKKKAHEVLSLSTNLVKNLIILLKPIMPMFANNVEKQLNLKNLVFTDLNFDLKNHKIGIADILFRKIELVKSEEKKSVFSKLDLKVAKIVDVKNHPNADKLYLIELDCGEKRRIVSGLKDFYSVDDLKGKNILLLYNLQPAKIRGEKSEGMLLAADTGDKIGLLFAEKSKPGDQVFVDGISNCSKQISYKEFSEVKIKSENGKAYFEGKPLKTSSETVFVDKKVDGNIC